MLADDHDFDPDSAHKKKTKNKQQLFYITIANESIKLNPAKKFRKLSARTRSVSSMHA